MSNSLSSWSSRLTADDALVVAIRFCSVFAKDPKKLFLYINMTITYTLHNNTTCGHKSFDIKIVSKYFFVTICFEYTNYTVSQKRRPPNTQPPTIISTIVVGFQ